jgi:hypothetical protein
MKTAGALWRPEQAAFDSGSIFDDAPVEEQKKNA